MWASPGSMLGFERISKSLWVFVLQRRGSQQSFVSEQQNRAPLWSQLTEVIISPSAGTEARVFLRWSGGARTEHASGSNNQFYALLFLSREEGSSGSRRFGVRWFFCSCTQQQVGSSLQTELEIKLVSASSLTPCEVTAYKSKQKRPSVSRDAGWKRNIYITSCFDALTAKWRQEGGERGRRGGREEEDGALR